MIGKRSDTQELSQDPGDGGVGCMSFTYILSIVIRVIATIWSLRAVYRLRDWRLATVAAAVGSVIVYQTYVLFVWYWNRPWTWTGSNADTYWVMDSFFTTLA